MKFITKTSTAQEKLPSSRVTQKKHQPPPLPSLIQVHHLLYEKTWFLITSKASNEEVDQTECTGCSGLFRALQSRDNFCTDRAQYIQEYFRTVKRYWQDLNNYKITNLELLNKCRQLCKKKKDQPCQQGSSLKKDKNYFPFRVHLFLWRVSVQESKQDVMKLSPPVK